MPYTQVVFSAPALLLSILHKQRLVEIQGQPTVLKIFTQTFTNSR
jgi:hypothetical protein